MERNDDKNTKTKNALVRIGMSLNFPEKYNLFSKNQD
ncbi:Putative protein [Zobellia galactanivorans]|uniref:Uncharacterized protein n=1 Tax=Zobellia galactanivorans (strain DSM 12802 / CCUG 47099 / CIP 106680 / NCIMB 13871 / Dsij) TaxID=63186 RepID=G0L1B1_ZOBGA|nr:Putative protein [Zobellia galactanivorans]